MDFCKTPGGTVKIRVEKKSLKNIKTKKKDFRWNKGKEEIDHEKKFEEETRELQFAANNHFIDIWNFTLEKFL